MSDKLSNKEKSSDNQSKIHYETLDSLDKLDYQDSYKRLSEALLKLNDFSIEMANVTYEEIYPLIVARAKEYFDVSHCIISSYEEEKNQLVIEYSSLSGSHSSLVKNLLGGSLIKYKVPVPSDFYETMFNEKYAISHSLFDITFGGMPKLVTKAIESAFSIKWVIGIALIHKDKLYGAITLFSSKDQPPPYIEEVQAFAGIVSNSLARKKAEESLSEKEQNYKHIFDSSNDAIVIQDIETGKFIEVNLTMVQMFGFATKEEAMNISPDRISATEVGFNFDRIKHNNQIAYEEGYNFFEWLSKKNNGENFWTEITLRTVNVSGKAALLLNIRDIDERKNAELELEKHKNELSVTLDSIGDGLLATDQEGLITRMNPVAEALTGWSESEALGKPLDEVFKIVNAITGEKAHNPVAKAISSGKVVRLTNHIKLISRNGKEYQIADSASPIVNENGELFGVVMVFRDVSESYRLEEELKASEESYRSLFENIQDVLYRVDTQGIITQISPSAEQYGFDRDSLIGKSVDILYKDPKKRQLLLEELQKYGSVSDFEIDLNSPNKEVITVSTNARLLFDESRQVIGIEGELRDISDRKKAEEKLIEQKIKAEESETRFKTLHNATFGGIAIHDQGLILDCNKGLSDITGYSYEELIGMDALLLMAEKSRAEVIEKINSSYDKPYEAIGIRKNGEEYPLRIHGKDIPYKGIIARVTEFRDISEQKKAERELVESEARYRTFIENNESIILMVDPETQSIIFANETASKFYGWTVDELIGMRMIELNVMSQSEINERVEGYLDKDYNHFYIKQKTKSGVIKDVEIYQSKLIQNNKPIISIIIHDVTERKIAEDKLLKLDQAIQKSSEVIFLTDVNGIITYINNEFTNLYGYTTEEVVGKKTPRILKSGSNPPDVVKTIWKMLLNKERIHDQFVNKAKDGRLIDVEGSSEAILDEQGVIIGFLAIQRDVTERKKAEIELIQAKIKAEESDNLKTAFLQNISHEIRTPLNGILGFSALLQDENITRSEMNDFTNMIRKSGYRLLEIVNNVLDISKIETGQIQFVEKPVSLNSALCSLYSLFTPEAQEKQIELTYYLPSKYEYPVISDETRITQILSNLISNAIKFTHNGKVEYGYKLIGKNLQFYVKDTGIGISKENYERIFDRFTQIDLKLTRGFEGAGLGLAICKGLVEKFGGKIWVESELDKGSTFYFTIPFHPAEDLDIEQIESLEKDSDQQNKVILIAEDDFTSYLYLCRVLKDDKYKILYAENGKTAVQMIKDNPQIDLVLLDIRMPIMDGSEAIELIKKIRPELPVIAQTAYAFKEEKDKILELGCDDYLTKPISQKVLLKALERFI